jgi:hypothetical protein
MAENKTNSHVSWGNRWNCALLIFITINETMKMRLQLVIVDWRARALDNDILSS